MPEPLGPCNYCGHRPAIRVCPGGDPVCRLCLLDLVEEEREEDEALGEWDSDEYFRVVYGGEANAQPEGKL